MFGSMSALCNDSHHFKNYPLHLYWHGFVVHNGGLHRQYIPSISCSLFVDPLLPLPIVSSSSTLYVLVCECVYECVWVCMYKFVCESMCVCISVSVGCMSVCMSVCKCGCGCVGMCKWECVVLMNLYNIKDPQIRKRVLLISPSVTYFTWCNYLIPVAPDSYKLA